MTLPAIPDPIIAVRQLLLSDEILMGTVQGVHAYQLPQAAPEPAVVLWAISATADDVLEGSPIGVDFATIQIDVHGPQRDVTRKASRQIRNVLTGFRGISATCYIKCLQQGSGISDLADRVSTGSDQARCITTQDFVCTFDSINNYPSTA